MANLTPSSCKTLSGYFVFFLPSTLLPLEGNVRDGNGNGYGDRCEVVRSGVDWMEGTGTREEIRARQISAVL